MPNNNPSGLGAFEFNLRFPGQYFDRETNIAYNAVRDYDPSVGRYIESDPIGLQGGLDTYSYVAGNPLLLVDPSGRCLQAVYSGPFILYWIPCDRPNPFPTQKYPGDHPRSPNVCYPDDPPPPPPLPPAPFNPMQDAIEPICPECWAIPFRGWLLGREIEIGTNFRFAPFGNRTGNPLGELPHYHRRITDGTGKTVPGGGIGRHRPWEGF